MHAMQYELTLPADYDMTVIRDRVSRKGRLLDAWDGLGFKAYLIRERGVDGSPVNQYAPFYLWNTTEGMNSFLWGGAFQGLVNDFGRPVVQHWTGLAYEEGGAADRRPGSRSVGAAGRRARGTVRGDGGRGARGRAARRDGRGRGRGRRRRSPALGGRALLALGPRLSQGVG